VSVAIVTVDPPRASVLGLLIPFARCASFAVRKCNPSTSTGRCITGLEAAHRDDFDAPVTRNPDRRDSPRRAQRARRKSSNQLATIPAGQAAMHDAPSGRRRRRPRQSARPVPSSHLLRIPFAPFAPFVVKNCIGSITPRVLFTHSSPAPRRGERGRRPGEEPV
jgi:hypothetical protein